MIFEQPLSDYYVAKMLDYSPKVEFFMQFIIDLKIFVDNSTMSEITDYLPVNNRISESLAVHLCHPP